MKQFWIRPREGYELLHAGIVFIALHFECIRLNECAWGIRGTDVGTARVTGTMSAWRLKRVSFYEVICKCSQKWHSKSFAPLLLMKLNRAETVKDYCRGRRSRVEQFIRATKEHICPFLILFMNSSMYNWLILYIFNFNFSKVDLVC